MQLLQNCFDARIFYCKFCFLLSKPSIFDAKKVIKSSDFQENSCLFHLRPSALLKSNFFFFVNTKFCHMKVIQENFSFLLYNKKDFLSFLLVLQKINNYWLQIIAQVLQIFHNCISKIILAFFVVSLKLLFL